MLKVLSPAMKKNGLPVTHRSAAGFDASRSLAWLAS